MIRVKVLRLLFMKRNIKYSGGILGLLIGGDNENDKTNYVEPSKESTGIERLKKMYFPNEYNEISQEMSFVTQSFCTGTVLGGCLGGFFRSKDAYVSFIESNKATTFETTLDAQNKLQSKVGIGFARGAIEWGWRVGFFMGTFSLIATSISVYCGKDTTILEYVTAGVLTGSIYKANLGPRAMLVGGLLGGTLSGIAGSIIFGILAISGLKFSDITGALYRIRQHRHDAYKEGLEAAATIKNDNLTRHHEHLVQSKGAVKVEEIQ